MILELNKLRGDEKYCLLFQGVGTDYRRFLKKLPAEVLKELENSLQEFYQIYPEFIDVYRPDLDSLAYSRSFESWALIMLVDSILFKTYCDNLKPYASAGYSMGLITSLICAESITIQDGIKMLHSIYFPIEGRHSDSECMLAVIGCDEETIINIIEKHRFESLEIGIKVDDNVTILTGEYFEGCEEYFYQNGAKVVNRISVPFCMHSNLIKDRMNLFFDVVDSTQINGPNYNIISAIDQRFLSNPNDLAEELKMNMFKALDWNKMLGRLFQLDIKNTLPITLNPSFRKMHKNHSLNKIKNEL